MIALRDQIDLSARPQRRATGAARSTRPSNSRDADSVTTRIVSDRSELHAALSLVYQAYIETQLIEANDFGMRATHYHLLSSTSVFIAEKNEEFIGTLTLVRDGDLGMPMEELYASEVDARRRQGKTVAEVSCLADSGRGKSNHLSVVVQLMSHMAQYAKRDGVDDLLIAVHPHHVGFYERFIGFEVIGDKKNYSAVCDNPAVPLALDLNAMPVNHPRAYERFFGRPFSDADLESRGLDDATLAELGWIVRLTQPSIACANRRALPAAA